jgi:hypothetical protein
MFSLPGQLGLTKTSVWRNTVFIKCIMRALTDGEALQLCDSAIQTMHVQYMFFST